MLLTHLQSECGFRGQDREAQGPGWLAWGQIGWAELSGLGWEGMSSLQGHLSLRGSAHLTEAATAKLCMDTGFEVTEMWG